MNRTAGIFLTLPLLGGCLGPSFVEGVWLVELPPSAEEACDSTLTENFENADPYDTPDTPDSEWTYEETTDASGSLFFVEVLEGKGGKAVLVLGSEAIPGTKDGNVYTFTWDDFENSVDSAEHESGYVYREEVNASSKTTLTFEKGKSGTATGTWSIDSSEEYVFAESDEWDESATGYWNGQIEDVSYSYLDGDASNMYDSADCADERCRITISQTCSGSLPVTMTWYASADDDVYEGVSGAGQ